MNNTKNSAVRQAIVATLEESTGPLTRARLAEKTVNSPLWLQVVKVHNIGPHHCAVHEGIRSGERDGKLYVDDGHIGLVTGNAERPNLTLVPALA